MVFDAMVTKHEPGNNGQLAQFISSAPDSGTHQMGYCFSRKHVAFEGFLLQHGRPTRPPSNRLQSFLPPNTISRRAPGHAMPYRCADVHSPYG